MCVHVPHCIDAENRNSKKNRNDSSLGIISEFICYSIQAAFSGIPLFFLRPQSRTSSQGMEGSECGAGRWCSSFEPNTGWFGSYPTDGRGLPNGVHAVPVLRGG